MKPVGIGHQELSLLGWISRRGEATVGEAALEFGEPRGLARSTVLTMMERLRAKRRLQRSRAEGVYVYRATETSEQMLRGLVRDFVEKTLDGSVSPFVAYLTEKGELSDQELAELDQLVSRLQNRQRRSRS